jgi:deoxyribonuclease V
MIVALDVQYTETDAHAAAIVFEEWNSNRPFAQYRATLPIAGDYTPGQFYLRELSPLLKVIGLIKEEIQYSIIDGYCHLSSDYAPGLGYHLHKSLEGNPNIIGVAKNRYRDSVHAIEIFRGSSKHPLFVISIGIDFSTAAQYILSMAGQHRIPTMLKLVDQLARSSAKK